MAKALPNIEFEFFLKAIPPFNLLPETALRELALTLTIQHFPPEAIILSPDGPPTRFLYMIRSGGAKFIIDGELVGILSERDLVISQGNNPIAIIRQIYQAPNLDALIQLRTAINRTLIILLNRGEQVKKIAQLITKLNDHLTVRVIRLAEEGLEQQGHGKPSLPNVWLALGSEDRQEQTLCSD
jgi:signal-transduction protein with cAMP-binding, CBS, and nucleotidyltransferase domain